MMGEAEVRGTSSRMHGARKRRIRVATMSGGRDLTAISHLHRCRSREKGTTGVASRGRPHRCHFEGMVGRLSWGLAGVEALLRLRLELAWVELLFEASGSSAG